MAYTGNIKFERSTTYVLRVSNIGTTTSNINILFKVAVGV